MTLDEKRKLMLAFDNLVRMGIRCTTCEYAVRLGISRSTFFRILEYMRQELKAPLHYKTAEGRYVYEKEGILFFGFLPYDSVSKNSLKEVNGAYKSYIEERNFLEEVLPSLDLQD